VHIAFQELSLLPDRMPRPSCSEHDRGPRGTAAGWANQTPNRGRVGPHEGVRGAEATAKKQPVQAGAGVERNRPRGPISCWISRRGVEKVWSCLYPGDVCCSIVVDRRTGHLRLPGMAACGGARPPLGSRGPGTRWYPVDGFSSEVPQKWVGRSSSLPNQVVSCPRRNDPVAGDGGRGAR
jgi:hypothetical protein